MGADTAVLRTLLETTADPVVVLDADGHVVDCNDAARTLVGIDGGFGSVAATGFFDAVPAVRDWFDDGRATDTEIVVDDAGTDRYFEPRQKPITGSAGGGGGSVVVLDERTTCRQRERELEAHRERYLTLFENDQLVVWEQDFSAARAYATALADTGEELVAHLEANPDDLFEILSRMDVHRVNEAALDFYGVDSKAELVENFDEMMVPDTRAGLTGMWAAMVDGDRYYCTECKFKPLDSDEIRYELMEVYVPGVPADDYSLVFTTATDITERKQREQRLAEAKARYRRILDRSTDYVLVCTEDGTIDYVSPGIETTLGYEPEELVETDAFEHVHPADRDNVRRVFEGMLAEPDSHATVEYRVRARNGLYRWVEARGGNYLDDPLLDGIMVTIRDVTDRKRGEQRLAAERDARRTLHHELATATAPDTAANTICAELVAMDAIEAAAVTTERPTGDRDVIAAAGVETVDLRSDGGAIHRTVSRRASCDTVIPAGGDSDTDANGSPPVAVPISDDGVEHGTLLAWVAVNHALGAETVQELLRDSADALGSVMASDTRKRALAADDRVELAVTVETAATPLSRVAHDAATTATVLTAVPRRDSGVVCYLTPGEPAAFVAATEAVDGIRHVERVGDGDRIHATVDGPVPTAVVADHGGRVVDATVTGETTTLRVRFRRGDSFDPVLDALTARFDGVSTGEFRTDPPAEQRDDPLAALTDRQREVLGVAHHSGYFEKPRAQNASEIADRLNVARPTFDEILRAAQRNLCASVLDTDGSAGDSEQ